MKLTIRLSAAILFAVMFSCSTPYVSRWATTKPQSVPVRKIAVCDLVSEYELNDELVRYANTIVKELIMRKMEAQENKWTYREISDLTIRNDCFPADSSQLQTGQAPPKDIDMTYYTRLYNRYLDTLCENYPRYDYFLIPVLKIAKAEIVNNAVVFDGCSIDLMEPGDRLLNNLSQVKTLYTGKLLCVSIECNLIDRNKKKIFTGTGGIGLLSKIGSVSASSWEEELNDFKTVVRTETLQTGLNIALKRY